LYFDHRYKADRTVTLAVTLRSEREAQRATVARFAEAEGLTIISEFVEAETGKGADALDRRPQLAAALAAAKAAKCCVQVQNWIACRAMLPSLPA
jgi:hypothetical protein